MTNESGDQVAALAALSALGIQRHYRAGAVILKEGEVGDALYILLEGRVQSYSQALSGKLLRYNMIEAGEFFGEMALDGGPRSASVKALTDCRCAVVVNSQVVAFCAQHSSFAHHLLTTVIGRARSVTQAAQDMALLEVYPRLAKVLNREFAQQNGVCLLTHASLAAHIGASRHMVSKLVRDLVKGHYLAAPKGALQRLKALPTDW